MDSSSEEQYEDSGSKRKAKIERMMIPYNYVSFVKDAVKRFDSSSTKSILDQLYEGVVLNEGKKKYWIDRVSNNNCFMIFPKALNISHGDNESYWRWESIEETRNGAKVEMAVLLDVCWLEIKGTFRTIALSPGTLYEVAFVVKMRETKNGWNSLVIVELTLPDGKCQTSERFLGDIRIDDDWAEVLVGEFTMSATTVGKLAFSLSQTTGQWKRGLVIKGVILRPKINGDGWRNGIRFYIKDK